MGLPVRYIYIHTPENGKRIGYKQAMANMVITKRNIKQHLKEDPEYKPLMDYLEDFGQDKNGRARLNSGI
jgi:hypothetical protein